MSERPPSPHPLGAEAPARDYVGLAVRAMASGILAGTALILASLWLVRTLQVGVPAASTPDLDSPAAFTLLLGAVAGVMLAAIVTWTLLSPIRSTYRQGGLAIVAGFATVVLVTVVSFPLDGALGRWGLLGAAVVAGLLARRLATAAGRAADAA